MFGFFVVNGFIREEVEGEIVVQIIVGFDMLVIVICFMLFFIIINLFVYCCLQVEIDIGICEGCIFLFIIDVEVRNLLYFQVVIWEGF